MNITKAIYYLQTTMLMLAVVLSSVHAKDVIKSATTAYKQSDYVKIHSDEGTNTKINAELHNHVDKQTLKMLYHSGDVQQHADRRALWQLDQAHLSLKDEFKVGMGIWLKMLAAKLLP